MDSIEQAKQDINKVISIIANTTPEEEKKLREYIYAIIALAIRQGKTLKFTFADNKELDDTVNQKLIELSDAIKDILDKQILTAINLNNNTSDEDVNDTIEYVNRTFEGKNIVDRLDLYHSELKYILESYIAAGIAEGLSAAQITQEYFTYKDNPLLAPLIRDAMQHRSDFATPLILSLGFSLGSGHYKSTIANYKRLSSYSIAEAYNYTALSAMRKDPIIIGYKTFRNSSFDCAICDELTKMIHPLDSLVVPAHPRCVCGIYPVTQEDKIADANNEYLSHSRTNWEHTYFDQNSGGYLVTSKARIKSSVVNKNELDKFNKEQSMCRILAKSGYRIEHLAEIPGISSPDITINGKKADLKYTKSANNIIKYAKHAIQNQGADLVVFQFKEVNQKILGGIKRLRDIGIHGIYIQNDRIIKF